MKVLTFANKTGGYFDYLVKSAERYQNEVTVIGWNKEWKGFGQRMLTVLDSLNTIPDREVVIVIDAYDTLFLRNLNDLEKQYREYTQKHGDKIVMSVENRGVANVILNVFFGKCGGQYINAGVYIGYAYLIKRVFGAICSNNHCDPKDADDQRMITQYCRDNRDDFDFDSDFDWFLTWGELDLYVGNKVRIDDGVMTFKNKRPFILHCPGNKNMDDIIQQMGWNPPKIAPRGVIEYYGGMYKAHTKHFVGKYTVEMMIVLLCVWLYMRRRG